MIDIERIAGGFDVPPCRASPNQNSHDCETTDGGDNRSASAVWRCNGSRLQASIPDSCGDDTGHADHQEETKDSECDSQAMLHLQRREGNGGHWNRGGLSSGV